MKKDIKIVMFQMDRERSIVIVFGSWNFLKIRMINEFFNSFNMGQLSCLIYPEK